MLAPATLPTVLGRRWRKGLAVVLLGSAACGGGGVATGGALVGWAEGKWRCDMKLTDQGEAGDATVDAEVKVKGPDHGTFSFHLDFPSQDGGLVLPEITGDWKLDGHNLKVSAGAVDDVTRYAISGAALDTDRIAIQEHAPGAKLQEVGIQRHGATVTFRWDHPYTGPGTLTCSRAT
jgi:hypothetical protein